jgi:hypothetical protein
MLLFLMYAIIRYRIIRMIDYPVQNVYGVAKLLKIIGYIYSIDFYCTDRSNVHPYVKYSTAHRHRGLIN